MKLSDFDYSLPKELIAQYPLRERDMARLLVLSRKQGTIEHCHFKNIADYLRPDDLLVLNNTKVSPSRIIGSRLTGGRVELLLLKQKSGLTFDALIRPGRIKLQEKLIFNGGKIYGEVTAKNEITFNVKDVETVYSLGIMPLPAYIKRIPEDLDAVYYQTVYAKEQGAIASPTAGLHFTKDLIKNMESLGIAFAYITLHVGLATFKPVKINDITGHRMDPEYFKVPQEAANLIEKTQRDKARIIAVGTTSCRALETFAEGNREGHTDLFIYPGYKFRMVDGLITNFHLPRTTLFMLVCAFAGEKFIKKAYQEAVDKKYRFYSYGDAMLVI